MLNDYGTALIGRGTRAAGRAVISTWLLAIALDAVHARSVLVPRAAHPEDAAPTAPVIFLARGRCAYPFPETVDRRIDQTTQAEVGDACRALALLFQNLKGPRLAFRHSDRLAA